MNVTIAPQVLTGDPEALAMLQAFYSRSKRGINDRLAETTLDLDQIKEKLKNFFIGYGHDSIGQTGFTTLFLEDVSILAAKMVEDNDLFNGQESSTRYIDYANSETVDVAYPEHKVLMQDWIGLYTDLKADIETALFDKYGPEMVGADMPEDEASRPEWAANVKLFTKACTVRAFDIAGAFLPAGVLTNVSWTTSLATLNRELQRMYAHPTAEGRALADKIAEEVAIRYPSIYVPKDSLPSDVLKYYASTPGFGYHFMPLENGDGVSIDVVALESLKELAGHARPRHARLPRHLHNAVLIKADVTMDYRSFRDVQRHRPLRATSPLLGYIPPVTSAVVPIGGWYMDCLHQLGLTDKYGDRITALIRRCWTAPGTPVEMQYVFPMGYLTRFTMTGFLGDWLYFLELRSGETVHATVRQMVNTTWKLLSQGNPTLVDYLPYLNPSIKPLDNDLMRPSFKRAAQDIVERKS